MNGESELPEGWKYVKLGDITSPSKERIDPKADSTIPYLGLEHIESNSSRIIGQGIAGETKSLKTVFHAGDVLYGKLRPYLNKVTIPDFEGVCSTDILVFNQNQNISNRYLMRFLSTQNVVEYANLNSKGISLPRVSFDRLAQISIPLPPLAEQRRIVAAVEALLDRVNASQERLDRVPGLLKAFRQAVLAAACSGRLTEGWRGELLDVENIAEFVEKLRNEKILRDKKRMRYLSVSNFLDRHEIPSTWAWVKLGEISITIDVDHKMPKAIENGISLISPKDFIEPNIIDFENAKKISHDDYDRMCRKIAPESGDILFSRYGTIGKVRKVPGDKKFQISYSLCLIRPFLELKYNDYLYWILQSAPVYHQALANDKSSSIPDVGIKDINNFTIPLPPLPEQHEIVRRVEALFALADRIEERVNAAKERADRLTQAILAKAFRGELVPTEAELAKIEGREYEPASVLLERIREEREAEDLKKKRSSRKRAARKSS